MCYQALVLFSTDLSTRGRRCSRNKVIMTESDIIMRSTKSRMSRNQLSAIDIFFRLTSSISRSLLRMYFLILKLARASFADQYPLHLAIRPTHSFGAADVSDSCHV